LPLPQETVCYRVVLPNSPRILEAFEGAILMLGKWTYWDRDDDHAATVAAKVFLKVYDTLRENMCNDELHGELEDGMKLRIDPDNSCIIQCLDECSGEWGTFLDVSQCAPGAITQAPPGGTPASGDVNCYDIVIQGNSQWISPIPVKEGDVIEITGVAGGWFDGAFWRCPNGQDYLLGGCTGSGSHQPSDPAPTILHARLIQTIDSGSHWSDAYNTATNIPLGTSPTNLILQMNDSSLSDNGGSITCRVCIHTNNVAAWSHTFDFTTGQHGWVAIVAPGDNIARAIYQPGTGFESVYNVGGGGNTELRIVWGVPIATVNITEYACHYDSDGTIGFFQGPNFTANITPTSAGTNVAASTGAISVSVTDTRLDMDTNSAHLNFVLRNLTVSGRGFDPFA
jgi:hypothetical protein